MQRSRGVQDLKFVLHGFITINEACYHQGHWNDADTSFTGVLAEGEFIQNIRGGLLLRHSNRSSTLNMQSGENGP